MNKIELNYKILLSLSLSLSLSHCLLFIFPNVGPTPPGPTTQMSVGRIPIGGTLTFDRIREGGSLKSVVSRTSLSPPEATQNKTHTKDTHNPSTEIIIADPAWKGTRTARLEARNCTDYVRATDKLQYTSVFIIEALSVTMPVLA